MANHETAQATQQKNVTLADIMAFLGAVDAKLDALGQRLDQAPAGGGARNRQSQREMTDDDARQVLSDLAEMKHNDAADRLGLSYGQVYSARLGYTFKHIRKELADAKVHNQWLSKTHAD